MPDLSQPAVALCRKHRDKLERATLDQRSAFYDWLEANPDFTERRALEVWSCIITTPKGTP